MGSDSDGSPTRRDPGAYVFLVLMILIGSTTAMAAKVALQGLPVGLVPILRFGVAGLTLLPVIGGPRAIFRLLAKDGGRLLVTAAFCAPINQFFFLSGTRLAPTTHVGLIYAVCPLVVLVLATLLGQERLESGRLLAIAVSISGALVIALGNLARSGDGHAVLRGDLLLVGAVLSWGAYLTVNKPLVGRHGLWTVLAGTFLVGALMSLPLILLDRRDMGRLATAPASAWWGMAHLALVVTPLGLACQNQALRRLDASQVAAVGNAAPFLTVLWGVCFLGESFTPSLALGGALTLAGILLGSRTTGEARNVLLRRFPRAARDRVAVEPIAVPEA